MIDAGVSSGSDGVNRFVITSSPPPRGIVSGRSGHLRNEAGTMAGLENGNHFAWQETGMNPIRITSEQTTAENVNGIERAIGR